MAFLTDLTPGTLRATAIALLMSACELTKPLSCTTPLKVSTLISADFSDGSFITAALTFVVMTLSSTYSPVPSCLGVDAQPKQEASKSIRKSSVVSWLALQMDGESEERIPRYSLPNSSKMTTTTSTSPRMPLGP